MKASENIPGKRKIGTIRQSLSVRFLRRGLPKSLFFTAIAAAAMAALFPASLEAESPSAILEKAASQLGTPYRYGGKTPGGFDCSGFVFYLYKPTLPSLPRMSRDMARTGSPVSSGSWSPGDLLFYATGSDPGRINHVAIWYGEGYIIHSISNGPETGVVMTPANSRYWSRHYVGSRRVLPIAAAEPVPTAPDESGGSGSGTAAAGGNADNSGRGSASAGTESSPPPVEEIVGDEDPEDSPWNDFDGFLRGDWEEWQKSDQEAFEEFLRKEALGN